MSCGSLLLQVPVLFWNDKVVFGDPVLLIGNQRAEVLFIC